MNTFALIALIVALLPLVVAILAGWWRSPDVTKQRRGSISLMITSVCAGIIMMVSGAVFLNQGDYVLAGVFLIAVALLVLSGIATGLRLRGLNHEIRTGEVYAASGEELLRNARMQRTIAVLAGVLIALALAGLIWSFVSGR